MAETFPILSSLRKRFLELIGKGEEPAEEDQESTPDEGAGDQADQEDWSNLFPGVDDFVYVEPAPQNPPGSQGAKLVRDRHYHSRRTYRAKRWAWRVANGSGGSPPRGGIPSLNGARLYREGEGPGIQPEEQEETKVAVEPFVTLNMTNGTQIKAYYNTQGNLLYAVGADGTRITFSQHAPQPHEMFGQNIFRIDTGYINNLSDVVPGQSYISLIFYPVDDAQNPWAVSIGTASIVMTSGAQIGGQT